MYEVRAEKRLQNGESSRCRAPGTADRAHRFRLEIGQASQTIEVTASPVTHDGKCDSRHGDRAETNYGSSTERTQLPQPGGAESERDLRFRSGRAGVRPTRRHALHDDHVALGRARTWSNYTLDGITNTDVNFNHYIVLPSVDALQEFKVQTGIYPAEFGREAGQINVSTKPGTNTYHGAVYEFLRNNKLDAQDLRFFQVPDSATTRRRRARLTGRINTASRWADRYGSRKYSTARTGCSSCRTMRDSSRAPRTTSVLHDNDACDARTATSRPCQRLCRIRRQAFESRTRTATFTVTSSPFPNNQIPANRFNPLVRLLAGEIRAASEYCSRPDLPNRNYQYLQKVPVDKDQFTGGSISMRAPTRNGSAGIAGRMS